MRDDVMKLDMLGSGLKRQLGVELLRVQYEPATSLFSYECLRSLTRQYAGKEEDANCLCEALSQAEEADARGDFATREECLGSYINQVNHLSLTGKSATILITLARTL